MVKKSKATKAVLASLLATSAIVPAMAVSAEVGGETTRTGEATTTAAKTIDFKVNAPESLQQFIPTTGKLVEREGQQFINLELPDAALSMVNSVTVAGKPVMAEYNGKKHINIPVTAEYAPVEVTLNMTIPFVGKDPVDYKVTLTPDAKTIKEVTETTKPVEEAKEEKIFKVGKTFDSVADGTYDIKWDAYKDQVGNYTHITRQLSTEGKLIVKDGKYSVAVYTTEASKEMIKGLKIAGKDATEKDGVYTVEIPSISDLHESSVHVVVPSMKMDTWYNFGFAIETANLELPKAEAAPAPVEATKMPVTVFKDGTKEQSIMQGTYLANEVMVTSTEGGYEVDVTFPQGQWLNEFNVEGATVALKSEETVGKNTVQIYTISLKDINEIYNATVDLTVDAAGVKYDSVHKVQLQFGEKKPVPVAAPFKDIANNGNKDAIVNLFNKGIFIAADNFNPGNNVKRAQFALMLNRALKLDVPAKAAFTDIVKYDDEAKKAINALNGYGIINGKTATTFAPAQDVTRKQAALMIYRLLEKNGYTATGDTAKFSDMPKEVEASKAISELNTLGIISGFEGKFNPENKLTRSQMAKILNNTLTVVEGLKK
ncbi:S-layer homology domain-containing protein [Solibacillus sp. A46]|uniref:S-layer homology domain-containing protein n=1 Tax=Solibacillus faecavium TaxID=2762221 RepID=A0ABR8XUN7_9BACL|nr:S-layer homology domain-containing protein [Solibacillus faecavium]MBD8035635.1 S-layer homology domain-containing protein [Solibacillus faecavium]